MSLSVYDWKVLLTPQFQAIQQALKDINDKLQDIKIKETKLMALEADLKTAIQSVVASQADEATKLGTLSTNVDAIIAKLSSSGQVPQEDIDALTAVKTALDSSSTSIQAASDKLATAAA